MVTDAGDVPEIAGITGLAERYQVEHSTVHQWIRRYSDFPEPVTMLGRQRVYRVSDVDEWIANRVKYRPKVPKPSPLDRLIDLAGRIK